MKWMAFVIAAGLFLGSIGCAEKTTVKTKEGGEFSITAPRSQSLKPGESEKIEVSTTRKNMDEDIAITFSNLPEGVTVDKKTQKIEKGANKAEFILIAAADAKAVENHKVTVTGEAKGTKANAEFNMTVKK